MSEVTNISIMVEIRRFMTFSNSTDSNDPRISDTYKKRIIAIREEVKEGKYTDYENIEELAKDIGL